MQSCFICNPDPRLIYAEHIGFFVMLGIGPIVEGYSLIATRAHIPSMLDLSAEEAENLNEFTQTVRERLRPHYGPIIITEHGRVPICEYLDSSGHEAHCFHAHRLVFPISMDLTDQLKDYGLAVQEFRSFIEAWQTSAWKVGEYLYYERPDGSCLVAATPSRLPRQFFRYHVASIVGRPEFESWRKFPRLEVVDAAMCRLGIRGASR